MSCFISELVIPKDSGGLPWVGCQHCRRRKDCPFVYDQALRRAARQGCTAAQLLTAEADRLSETISSAEDGRCFLDANEALEHVLSHALRSEMTLINELCAQATEQAYIDALLKSPV